MKKVSKAFFLGSVAAGLVGYFLYILVSIMTTIEASAGALFFLSLSWILMVYGEIVMLVLFYKMWAAIQDGQARTTPGKAVGFMFIPLFSFYWIFQAIWGYAKDYNAYIRRHGIKAERLPEGLFLAYTILFFIVWIPLLFLALMSINYAISLVMVSRICDAINGEKSIGETKKPIKGAGYIEKAVKGLSNLLNIIAGASITFMIVLTVSDVILKNLKMAIPGTYELVMFAGAVVVGFALPMTTLAKGHVLVDFLVLRFSKDVRDVFNVETRLIGIFLFAIASWNMVKIGMSLARTGEVSMTLQIPFYPIAYGIAFTCLVQCLVLIAHIMQIEGGSYE